MIGRIAVDQKAHTFFRVRLTKQLNCGTPGRVIAEGTFYPPAGDNQKAAYMPAALSPDGRIAAFPGWTGWSITGKARFIFSIL